MRQWLARVGAFLDEVFSMPLSLPFGGGQQPHYHDHPGLEHRVDGQMQFAIGTYQELRDRLTRLELALLVKGVITSDDLKALSKEKP